jgi:enoyl-CoA hydratase
MDYVTLDYDVADRIATITLNRPDRLNAIVDPMPLEIRDAVTRANRDDAVHVIVLTGAGRAFCAGYDLQDYAEVEGRDQPGSQEPPYDPFQDYLWMYENTECFRSLWKSHKPTIAKIRGYAVAGGSDIALSCDFVIMAEDARIGYPPARVWGCPTTMMWAFRVGAEQAKRMLLTGDLIDGAEAARIGLVLKAVPEAKLDDAVQELADRMKGVPKNQLWMNKQVVNSVFEQAGLVNAQSLATIFDGLTRHTPEGEWFKERAAEVGFKQAVRERDSGAPIPGSKPIRWKTNWRGQE